MCYVTSLICTELLLIVDFTCTTSFCTCCYFLAYRTLTETLPAWEQWNFRLCATFSRTQAKKTPKMLNFSGSDEEIQYVLNKLVFVIDITHNEVELDTVGILKTESEICFQLIITDSQFNSLSRKLLDWFKKKKMKEKTV